MKTPGKHKSIKILPQGIKFDWIVFVPALNSGCGYYFAGNNLVLCNYAIKILIPNDILIGLFDKFLFK